MVTVQVREFQRGMRAGEHDLDVNPDDATIYARTVADATTDFGFGYITAIGQAFRETVDI